MDYQPTIGLEIHAELKTRTKMFCDCINDPDEKHPNINTCPVCLGHPGTLPTINKQAVELVVKTGLALNGKINPVTKFDRKNYFYPDLPKGYQISQFDQPLVVGGELTGIHLTRIHLEEDAGRLVHSTNLADQRGPDADSRGNGQRESASSQRQSASLVDFNRAGVPLMELVTEPEMKDVASAVRFAKEFQLLLRYIGASDADLERGQMRFDLNISIAPAGAADQRGQDADSRGNGQRESASSQRQSASTLGAKVEIKNLNSFRALEEAIPFEIKRQSELLEKGEKVKQETRGWDDIKKKTVSQRSKEDAHDYRYFPEPDLPPIDTSIFNIEDMRRHMPELPDAKRARFQKEFTLSAQQAEILVQNKTLANFFEEAVSELSARDDFTPADLGKEPTQLLFNYLTSDLVGLTNEMAIETGEIIAFGEKVAPEKLAHLIDLIVDGKIMSRQAKDILVKMVATGDDPEDIMKSEGLETVSDTSELEKAIKEVMAENPAAVVDYKKGKTASMQFFIGKAMGKLKGRGNPEKLRELLTNLLK